MGTTPSVLEKAKQALQGAKDWTANVERKKPGEASMFAPKEAPMPHVPQHEFASASYKQPYTHRLNGLKGEAESAAKGIEERQKNVNEYLEQK